MHYHRFLRSDGAILNMGGEAGSPATDYLAYHIIDADFLPPVTLPFVVGPRPGDLLLFADHVLTVDDVDVVGGVIFTRDLVMLTLANYTTIPALVRRLNALGPGYYGLQ